MDEVTVENVIPQITDKDKWQEIVKILLEGVMFHISCFEKFSIYDLEGFSDMHHHHALEEFKNYICTYYHYVNHYKDIINSPNITKPTVEITGTYENGLEVYENWEKKVLNKLELFYETIEEEKDDLKILIDDVKKELYCIRRMWDDVYCGKREELNSWLHKKYGEC